MVLIKHLSKTVKTLHLNHNLELPTSFTDSEIETLANALSQTKLEQLDLQAWTFSIANVVTLINRFPRTMSCFIFDLKEALHAQRLGGNVDLSSIISAIQGKNINKLILGVSGGFDVQEEINRAIFWQRAGHFLGASTFSGLPVEVASIISGFLTAGEPRLGTADAAEIPITPYRLFLDSFAASKAKEEEQASKRPKLQ